MNIIRMLKQTDTNLIECIIASVEDELDGNISTVLDTLNASCGEVDVHAEVALGGGLEERQELLEVETAVPESVESVRVLDRRDNSTN